MRDRGLPLMAATAFTVVFGAACDGGGGSEAFGRSLLPPTAATIESVELVDSDQLLVTVGFPAESRLRHSRAGCWELFTAPGGDGDRIGVLSEPEEAGAVGSLATVDPGIEANCTDIALEGSEAKFTLPLQRDDDRSDLYLCYSERYPDGCLLVDAPNGS